MCISAECMSALTLTDFVVSNELILICRNIETALEEQRTRFKAQSRDLAMQIRYLKAKFTRESTFRNALALQKRYLLLLVGGMSLK